MVKALVSNAAVKVLVSSFGVKALVSSAELWHWLAIL